MSTEAGTVPAEPTHQPSKACPRGLCRICPCCHGKPCRMGLFGHLGLAVAVLTLALDQASKWLVVERMDLTSGGQSLTSFFNLVLVQNKGVSFGVFNHDSAAGPWLLTALAVVIVGVLIAWLRKAERRVVAVGLGLAIGGALGNVIDRVRLGAVTDFLDFHLDGLRPVLPEGHWPAFNVADSAICVGVVLLVLDGLVKREKSP